MFHGSLLDELEDLINPLVLFYKTKPWIFPRKWLKDISVPFNKGNELFSLICTTKVCLLSTGQWLKVLLS